MSIDHYIVTIWKNGRTTKDSWQYARWGRPSGAKFQKVVQPRMDEIRRVDLVRSNGEIMVTINNDL